MTSRKPNRRWVAPVAAAGLVIASPALFNAMANAEPTLPDRTADQIIADVLAAEPVALSGEISQRVDLGLPDLGQTGVDLSSDSALWNLAQGSNTWRIWFDGEQSYRVSIVRGQSESDVISNGEVLWIWSSDSQTAQRQAIEAPATGDPHPMPSTPAPTDTARQILAQLEQYSAVTTDANVRVAGRAAYELVITPSDDQTRVRQVRMAVDAETSLPLRVQVFSTTGQAPVIDIGFTQLSYDVPNASVFEFTPPPGAEVIEVENQVPAIDEVPDNKDEDSPEPEGTEVVPANTQQQFGEGWSTVWVTTSPADDAAGTGLLREYLPAVSGAWGSGVVLDGTLFSVVFADDGRMAYGAVAPEVLYQALQ